MSQKSDNRFDVHPNDEMLEDPALLRLGMEREYEIGLSSIIAKLMTPASKTMQQAMIVCYRDFYDEYTMCKLHVAAAEKDPCNEFLVSDLFFEYVTIRDYQKQYETALTLYKLKPENPYYFWAVMSVVMQAQNDANNKEKQLMLLELAEKMVKDLVECGGKIKTDQEVQLYLMILEMQGKLIEALEVVEGPLGNKLRSYIVAPRKRVDLLVKLGRWKEANVTIKELLRNNVDDWKLYLDYLNTAFHLIDGENSESYFDSCGREQPDKTTTDCVNFLCDLQKVNGCRLFRHRGLCLVQMEFLARMRAGDKHAASNLVLGNFTEMLSKYFREFGDKECCLNDLRNYIDLLEPNEVSRFLKSNLSIFDVDKSKLHEKKLQMLQLISNIHMNWYLGFYQALSYTSRLQLAAYLMSCYHLGVQLNSSTEFSIERQFNDSLVLMVANLMNDVWIETGLSFYLRDAIIVLEHALTKSPSNFQIKLFLIRLYNRLGISKAAHTIYGLLNIEEVQLDSLGYLQCWPLLFTGQYQLASQLYEKTLKFFSYGRKISALLTGSTFRYGSFLKISEFVEFHDRLNTSLHNSLVAVENNLLKIFHASSFPETIRVADIEIVAKEDIDWSCFVDNRDFSIYWTVDPHHRGITPDVVKTSFKHDLHYLHYRTLLLRIIVSLVNVANAFCVDCTGSFINLNGSVPNGVADDEKNSILDKSHMDIDNVENVSKQDPRKVVELLAEELQTFSLGEKEKPLHGVCIISPDESRIFAVMKSSYTEFLVCLLRVVTSVSSDDPFVTYINKLTNNCDSMIKGAVINLEQEISKLSTLVRTANPAQLVQHHEILTSLTLIIEMVCIATVVCAVVQHIITVRYVNFVLREEQNKKENATNDVNVQSGGFAGNQQHTAFINQLFQVISETMHNLDRIIVTLEDGWKDISVKEDNISCLLEKLELSSNDVSQIVNSVQCKMSESYLGSLTEIHTVLKIKIKYLCELSLYSKT